MKKLALIITILFSLSSFNIAMAEDVVKGNDNQIQELKDQLKTLPTSHCLGNLIATMDLEFIAFQTFMDETFRSKSSNSSLTNIAIAKFTEYRLALEDIFAQINPAIHYDSSSNEGSGGSVDENISFGIQVKYDSSTDNAAYSACFNAMETYVENGRNMMIEHIKNSTAQKKTMMILEKYESINEKMRDLNFEIAQMYGYFLTFKDKLHWINGKCVQ